MRDLRRFVVACFVFCTIPASAQITITAQSLAGVGVTYTNHSTIDNIPLTIGPSGANQTWTIPTTEFPHSTDLEYITPSSSPYFGDFSTATHCAHYSYEGGEGHFFYQLTENGYFSLGTADILHEENSFHYDLPEKFFPIPLDYDTPVWTSVSQWTFEISPGVEIVTRDSTIHTIDGWGTIETQYGSYQVLRDFSHTWSSTTFTGFPPETDERVSYGWVNNQGISIAGMSADGSDPNFGSGFLNVSEITTVAVDPIAYPIIQSFFVSQNYPNPFNPETTLPLEVGHEGRVTLSVFNELGQRVMNKQYFLPAGNSNLKINGSNWSSGIYFAEIRSGEDIQTVKMQLVK